MALNTLHDDLINEFRDEYQMINEQIALLDPLGTTLRKPAAQRLIGQTTLILVEICCYLLFAALLFFLFIIHKTPPFSLMKVIYTAEQNQSAGTIGQLNLLIIYGYGALAILAFLLLIVGLLAGKIRNKNAILQHASRDIKTIIGQHLVRRAALEAIEQRHVLVHGNVAHNPIRTQSINDIKNPGFDEEDDDE